LWSIVGAIGGNGCFNGENAPESVGILYVGLKLMAADRRQSWGKAAICSAGPDFASYF